MRSLKRLSFLLIFVLTLSSFAVVSLATYGGLPENLVSGDTRETSQFLPSITRPDGDKSTYRKSYVVSGIADESDIAVAVAIYNSKTGKYEAVANVDGEYSWDAKRRVIFSKEVKLPYVGANKLKIMAYRKSDIDSLKVGENFQVSYFTITRFEESVKNEILTDFIKPLDSILKFIS